MQGHDCIYVCADDTPRHADHAQGAGRGHHARGSSSRASRPSIAPTSQGFLIGFDHFHSTHSPENRRHRAICTAAARRAGTSPRAACARSTTRRPACSCPTATSRATCPNCGTPDQYGDNCENCGATYSPDRADRPGLGVSRHRAGAARVRALLLQARRLQSVLREWLEGDGAQQAEVGQAAEWLEAGLRDWDISRDAPYFGFEIPGAPGQVFLRLARCADRLPRQLQGAVRQARAGLRRVSGGRTAPPSCTTSSARTSSTSTACSGRRCCTARACRKPTARARPRLPDRQRREDVEVARHLHHGAQLPRSLLPPEHAALLLRGASSAPASTTST